MHMKLEDPRNHQEWLTPHTFAWYAQIAALSGAYAYSWKSTIAEPNAETRFEQEVREMIRDRIVLDVGCGHGEFTVQWSPIVKRITGLDVTSGFIPDGRKQPLPPNTAFVTGNTKERLPFADGEFDCAYNRRGPTSCYPHMARVLKPGGRLLALHPGDRLSRELPRLFPGFFEPAPDGTPILDRLGQRLDQGGLKQVEIETVTSVQYLHDPMDVIRIRCFGQSPVLIGKVIDESLPAIEEIFRRHATAQGLPATYEHYLVRAVS